MQTSLPDDLQREVESLIEQFGTPIIRDVAVGTRGFWQRQTQSRTSEVCMLDEIGGALGVTDPNERLAAYREIEPAELPAIADHLDQLPDVHDEILADNWQVWGRFRAVIHRVVWDALNTDG